MKKNISLLSITALFFLISSFLQHRKPIIDGVWKVVEVQTVKPNGSFTSTFPSESQIIFSHNYYSFCWTSHKTSTRSWQMADSTKLNRMNQSIINTGTYELKNSTLTTKATFAMNPMFVNGVATFACSFAGDTLILTGQNVLSSENIPNPVYANGLHFVNKLVKVASIK